MTLSPKCPGGDACENKVFLEEYEKVDREHERHLVRECAALRAQVSRLEATVAELRDPEETRGDGVRVRKDRWQNGIRNIAASLGWRGPQEVSDVVAAVRKLIDDQRANDRAATEKGSAGE